MTVNFRCLCGGDPKIKLATSAISMGQVLAVAAVYIPLAMIACRYRFRQPPRLTMLNVASVLARVFDLGLTVSGVLYFLLLAW